MVNKAHKKVQHLFLLCVSYLCVQISPFYKDSIIGLGLTTPNDLILTSAKIQISNKGTFHRYWHY